MHLNDGAQVGIKFGMETCMLLGMADFVGRGSCNTYYTKIIRKYLPHKEKSPAGREVAMPIIESLSPAKRRPINQLDTTRFANWRENITSGRPASRTPSTTAELFLNRTFAALHDRRHSQLLKFWFSISINYNYNLIYYHV